MLNMPGQRYQLLTDGNGTPMKIWGGFSCNLYDGHWVNCYKKWLDHQMDGSILVGDCHYWSAQNDLKKAELMAIVVVVILD